MENSQNMPQKSELKLKKSVETIIDTICEYFKISIEKVCSKSRKKDVVNVRHFCIYIIRKSEKMSLQEIGGIFKIKQHGSVLNAFHKIDSFIEQYEQYREDYKEIKFRLSLKNVSLDNKNIYRHLAFIFMTNHPELFVKTGITKNDVTFLADDFKVSSDFLSQILEIMEKHEKEKQENRAEKFVKTKTNDLGPRKGETIKPKVYGEDILRVRGENN